MVIPCAWSLCVSFIFAFNTWRAFVRMLADLINDGHLSVHLPTADDKVWWWEDFHQWGCTFLSHQTKLAVHLNWTTLPVQLYHDPSLGRRCSSSFDKFFYAVTDFSRKFPSIKSQDCLMPSLGPRAYFETLMVDTFVFCKIQLRVRLLYSLWATWIVRCLLVYGLQPFEAIRARPRLIWQSFGCAAFAKAFSSLIREQIVPPIFPSFGHWSPEGSHLPDALHC